MHQEPSMCRPHAYYFFARQLPVLETSDGLLNAAIAIAMHELPGVEPALVRNQLSAMAQRVRRRVRGRQPQALLAHLHDVLFEEEGYVGNSQDYYSSLNSYIPSVLESRRGIPITLCLLYKVVAEMAGMTVEGVNSPGHFLARVSMPDGWMIVDPYFRGGVLTESEAYERIEFATSRPVSRLPRYLKTATHAVWISRMLLNLQHVFASSECQGDLAAMSELQSLLDLTVC
jgi:regulator of sirC expression with transglutaminase-like and TPR domain